ncbi:MAG: hypothetical protein K2M56_07070 [Muribaculaceae bacterium]|nr:hypothetical protein [Muribaculaceae bacterium]
MIDIPEKDKILPPQTAYRKRLSDMLDLTYELEGLLHIGVTRSAVPPRLNQLIVDKLNAIVALADEPATPEELGVVAEAVTIASPEIVTPDTNESQDPSVTAGSVTEASATDFSVTDTSVMDASVIEEEVSEPETAVIEQPEPEEESEEESEEINNHLDDEDGATDDGADYEIEETAEDEEKISAPAPQRGRLFSINDRFLYARELFGGDLKNFDRAIDEIITLDSYDEAEEYLVTEWDLDPESPSGMKFLSIISKLF